MEIKLRQTPGQPDNISQGGEAQVDGCALLQSVRLRPRRPLALTTSQVHQVDVRLLCDALFGKDLTGSDVKYMF